MSKGSNGHRPGGGAHSKNIVRPPQRTGQGATRIRHAGVAQIGIRQGSHVTAAVVASVLAIAVITASTLEPVRWAGWGRRSWVTNGAPRFLAASEAERLSYKSGAQHGLVDRQMPKGPDILGQFGPGKR